MPRRNRTNWPLLFGLSVFLIVICHHIAWPMIEHALGAAPLETDKFGLPRDPGAQSRERAMTTLTSLWFFITGASIGSFLNVVAYRMPMGLTFINKPSRCPYCETPIRFKHNVPILGWLVLRGRCDACRLPISPRYIIVELIVGVMFFTVFLMELASGGRNLPIRPPNTRPGVMWNLFTPQYDLIGIYAFHVFLLAVIATMALMKFDKLRIPPRLGFFALAMGVSLRWIWPHLVVPPLPVWVPSTLAVDQVQNATRILLDVAFGAIFGAIVQGVISLTGKHRFAPSVCGSMIIFSLLAIYLGWQAVIPVLTIAALFYLGLALVGRMNSYATSGLWAASFLVGAWVTICYWRQLPTVWLPGATSPLTLQLTGAAFGIVTIFVSESLATVSLDDRDAESFHTSSLVSATLESTADQSVSVANSESGVIAEPGVTELS